MINLTKTTSRASSGSTFRTYDIDGVKLGASPIEELIPLTISNLEQNFYKEFDLSKFCNCDLMAVIFRADFPIDDTETSVLNYRGGTLGADCIVRVLDQDRVIERIDLQISSYPTIQINPLVIDRRYTYQVTTSTTAKPGMCINTQEAEMLLKSDLRRFERAVDSLTHVPLNQAQFDALVSFTFNVGIAAFGKSTLLKKLNRKDYSGAANEFGRWVNAGKKRLPGLVSRRQEERKLFLS